MLSRDILLLENLATKYGNKSLLRKINQINESYGNTFKIQLDDNSTKCIKFLSDYFGEYCYHFKMIKGSIIGEIKAEYAKGKKYFNKIDKMIQEYENEFKQFGVDEIYRYQNKICMKFNISGEIQIK